MADEVSQKDANNRRTVFGITKTGEEIYIFKFDDTTGRLLVESLTEVEGHGTVGDGTATVTTAGTRVQLSTSSVSCKRVIIQANVANTGVIVVGGSTVVATEATRRGLALTNQSWEIFYASNLNLIYIDSTANGDKVNYYYEN